MTKQKRAWITFIFGIVAVILVIALSPSPVYQARGILLPAQQTRAPIAPHQVMQLPALPSDGRRLGDIRIERHYPAPEQTAYQEIAQLAEKLSAQVGANAFVVSLFRIGQVTKSKFIYVFRATAYYTPTAESARGNSDQ